jgi:predicted secreted protein
LAPTSRLDAANLAQELTLNGRPLSLSRPSNRNGEPEPLRHVIDQYKHREQTITCVCGWHGSCATNSTGGSDWTTHLNQFRTKRK